MLIDGYDVVRGFGDAVTDPVALSRKIAIALSESDEQKACAALTAEIDAISSKPVRTQAAQFKAQKQIEALSSRWPPLAAALDAKKRELTLALSNDASVYFRPGTVAGVYEDLITDEQFAAFAAIEAEQAKDPHRCMICMDLSTVVDNRGVVYWTKGKAHRIGALGETVPAGASLSKPK